MKPWPTVRLGEVLRRSEETIELQADAEYRQITVIVFTAPLFEGGKLLQPARVTMFHNGVLVHLNEEIRGETGHRILPEYKTRLTQGPLVLSGHNCPVRFRNIWVRPL
jgi:hypothetical protein